MQLEDFDIAQARARCRGYRRRILDISQTVPALHVAPAFSCIEIVDFIYHHVLRGHDDIVIMSKGHGAIAQYVVMEHLGILPEEELNQFGQASGIGTHPDLGTPGIAASTGSLGHGLGIGVGIALANKMRASDARTVVLISDGELFEGSTWEAILQTSSLGLSNVIMFIDNNDWTASMRISHAYPSFYPITGKLYSFGWETFSCAGHQQESMQMAINWRAGDKPVALVCDTVKGKGVSFMENNPTWAYRSPNPEEYEKAIKEIG